MFWEGYRISHYDGIEIKCEFDISYNGKGQGTENSSIGLEIEPIEEIGAMNAILD